MTWNVVLWLSSAGGAVLFFGAGALIARGARSRSAAVALYNLQQETVNLQGQLEQLTVDRANLHGEANRSRTERQELRVALDAGRRDAAALEAESQRLSERLRKLAVAETSLQAELATKKSEVAQGRERLDTQRRAHQQLQQENAELRAALAGKETLEQELGQLRAETELRSRSLTVPEGTRLLTMDGGGRSRGSALQELVEKVCRLADIRSAVVADDLGLVVASHGELADEVAAVGALFGRAGVQAQRVLPLRSVQRVTVEDDQDVVLTLRPLRIDDLGDAELALITLSVGAGPEERQVNELIDERPAAKSPPGRRSIGASP